MTQEINSEDYSAFQHVGLKKKCLQASLLWLSLASLKFCIIMQKNPGYFIFIESLVKT